MYNIEYVISMMGLRHELTHKMNVRYFEMTEKRHSSHKRNLVIAL